MGGGHSKKKHPTHDRTKVGWTSDEYDKINDEYAADLETQLKKFNTDHPRAFMMPGAMLDGRGAPIHGLPIGFMGVDISGDSLRDAGIKKIKHDVYSKYKPLLDAAPSDKPNYAPFIPVIPESVANVTDMIPGVNFLVREERAFALMGDPDHPDRVNEENNLAIQDLELDIVTGGVGPVVRSVGKLAKGGVKAGTKATKLVRGGISGSKIVTMGAGKSLLKVAADEVGHLAANEANRATLKAGVEEAGAAALKAEEEAAAKILPKATSGKGISAATALVIGGAAATAAPLVAGLVNKVTETKREKEEDDWRSNYDPLYGPLMTYCRGSMILMFQDKKSCEFIKFVSPVLLGAGVLAVLPKDIDVSKRIIAALGVSSGYYVVKEDVFHIFVKVPEDEKGNGPAQSVDHVDTGGDTHTHPSVEDTWYKAMEAKFMER